MTTCMCMGPQRGEPFCPCVMRRLNVLEAGFKARSGGNLCWHDERWVSNIWAYEQTKNALRETGAAINAACVWACAFESADEYFLNTWRAPEIWRSGEMTFEVSYQPYDDKGGAS